MNASQKYSLTRMFLIVLNFVAAPMRAASRAVRMTTVLGVATTAAFTLVASPASANTCDWYDGSSSPPLLGNPGDFHMWGYTDPVSGSFVPLYNSEIAKWYRVNDCNGSGGGDFTESAASLIICGWSGTSSHADGKWNGAEFNGGTCRTQNDCSRMSAWIAFPIPNGITSGTLAMLKSSGVTSVTGGILDNAGHYLDHLPPAGWIYGFGESGYTGCNRAY